MSADPNAACAVHDALAGYLNDGEIAVGWCLTIDVARPDGGRYLAHRAGGGHDGTEPPMCWAALGMLQSGVDDVRDQLRASTFDPTEEDDDAAGS